MCELSCCETDADRKIVSQSSPSLFFSFSVSLPGSSRGISRCLREGHASPFSKVRAFSSWIRNIILRKIAEENYAASHFRKMTFQLYYRSRSNPGALSPSNPNRTLSQKLYTLADLYWCTWLTCEPFIFKSSVKPRVKPKSCFESIYGTYDIHVEVIIKLRTSILSAIFEIFDKWLIYMNLLRIKIYIRLIMSLFYVILE